jgi:hypothetical protein
MDLKNYFENTRGMGVLSTADDQGKVNAAVYARPHFLEDGSLAFIVRDRLTHHNLQPNPHAAFLFREEGTGYKGVRLHLTKTLEESGTDRVKDLCRRCKIDDKPDAVRFLVAFTIDRELPLVGAGEPDGYPQSGD